MAAQLIVKTTADGFRYHAPLVCYVVFARIEGKRERITHYWDYAQAAQCRTNFWRYDAWIEEHEPTNEVDRPLRIGG